MMMMEWLPLFPGVMKGNVYKWSMKLNVPRLILGQQRPPPATPGQAIPNERAFCYVQFYPVMSATSSYKSSIPINPGMDEVSLDSDSSSFTTL